MKRMLSIFMLLLILSVSYATTKEPSGHFVKGSRMANDVEENEEDDRVRERGSTQAEVNAVIL